MIIKCILVLQWGVGLDGTKYPATDLVLQCGDVRPAGPPPQGRLRGAVRCQKTPPLPRDQEVVTSTKIEVLSTSTLCGIRRVSDGLHLCLCMRET